MLRRLSFVIERDFGTDETVQVVATVKYELDPESSYFPTNITRVFASGQSTVRYIVLAS